ncbi:sensor histidine kinase [Chloroflexota bacterium]
MFRIAQEALRNAERHAGASRIIGTITFTQGKVKLEVLYNGVGFTLPSPATDFTATRQLGIIGMQERVNLFGGRLKIQSNPGSGTRIITSLPGMG